MGAQSVVDAAVADRTAAKNRDAAGGEDPDRLFAEILAVCRVRAEAPAGRSRTMVALSPPETGTLDAAYAVAARAHAGQMRASGAEFITHPLSVALILAGLGMDATTLVAALLHDAVEDTGLTLGEIEEGFGADVASIVDGVTKLDRLHFESRAAQQAATIRKMLIAIASDWRVLIIKLADRLHNLRTIAAMPEWKQRRSAQETLDIYAPLAHRLGVAELKWQLEDLSFAVLHPRRHAEIAEMVERRAPERQAYLDKVLPMVRDRLGELGVKAEVRGRPKHLWSIYEKMVVRGKDFDEIHDLVGIRVIVDAERDCWAALGALHSLWSPVPGRFKDYINTPKFNLYQSLHTTAIGPEGKPIELQIRTWDMHSRAEHGIAAHWGYKEEHSHEARQASRDEMAWLKRIVDLERDLPDPVEFLESLKLDLEQDEVYVFTPKGLVVTLPAGATPIDFAYAIHTEIGHRCIGARISGRLVPLDTKLASGQTVEVFTSKVPSAGPSRDWLAMVASARARTKIRQWFSRERREDAIDAGREALTKAARRESLPVVRMTSTDAFAAVLAAMNYPDVDALHAAIGEGHVSAQAVIQRLTRELRGGEHEEQLPATVLPSRKAARGESPGIFVEGLDDMMVRLSRCCMPVPGDAVTGFVTRGRGVSVHRADCANALSLAASHRERLIEVEWDRERAGTYTALVDVRALDRSALLADVSRVMAENHVNIVSCTSHVGGDRVARLRFELELADPAHLESTMRSLKRVESVYDAFRVLPGTSG